MQIEDTVDGARQAKGTSGSVHVKITDPGPSVDVANGCTVVELGQFDYETVAASQSNQALGVTGGLGDYLNHLLIVPATTGAGTVAIKDGANAAINVFVTGTLSNLTPIIVPLHIVSTNGAWQITTGANVSVIAVGRFTA
jgi:hypothetical protein